MNLYDISVFLREHNNYEILTHNYPDGDTLGSGYAALHCSSAAWQKRKE